MNATADAAPFQPGTQVYLRSGGPEMTVLDVGRDTGMAWCRWMSGTGEIREATFPPQSLRAAASQS